MLNINLSALNNMKSLGETFSEQIDYIKNYDDIKKVLLDLDIGYIIKKLYT